MEKILLVACLALACGFTATTKRAAPVLDLPPGNTDSYHGTIKETDTLVTVSPEIRILSGTGPVCSYAISAIENGRATGGSSTTTTTTAKKDELVRRTRDTKTKALSKLEDESSDEDEDEDDEDDYDSDEDMFTKTKTPASMDTSKLPFKVDITDKTTGHAIIRLRDDAVLDCSRASYKFKIAPKKCGNEEVFGDGSIVEVHVEDTNNHDPEFTRSWYTVEVDEGRLYDHVLKLEAKDADCGHPYGEICRYEITNNAAAFQISQTGVLKIVQPLNFSVSRTHVISVVAYDCGLRHSKPVLVTVKVNEVCALGLTGMAERIEYTPGDGAKRILVNVTDLKLCDLDCDARKVDGRIQLHTKSAGRKACDRERHTASSLKEACGADPASVDLLPKPEDIHFENPTSSLLLDPNSVFSDDLEASDVYTFDGEKNAVIVPIETIKPHVPDNFTLSFWMKHDKPEPKAGINVHRLKENILCSSDDHRMNRHHFAVYVRNCKLELLIRRETPNKRRENEFQPAEWRWHLPQACDNKWHHYSLSMKFPQIDLYVDGKGVMQREDNTEILDDWPMHVANDLKTKLVVGACWHGGAGKMSQFFKGYLAEMVYLPGRVERPGVLQCALQCQERLDFTGMKHLKDGEEVVINGDASEIALKALSVKDYVSLLRAVTYGNRKSFPSAGWRTVSVSTTLSCAKTGHALEPVQLPLAKANIDIMKAADPSIQLEGSLMLTRPRADIEQGVNIFPDIQISIHGGTSAMKDKKLDYCKIRTIPALNKEREYFSSPATLISSLNLDFEHVNDGLMLKGNEKAKSYEAVLQQIHYFNNHPSDVGKRIFTAQCSMMDGRIKSNEFIVAMSIQSPQMQELKPLLTVDTNFNHSSLGNDGREKMTTGPVAGTDKGRVDKIDKEKKSDKFETGKDFHSHDKTPYLVSNEEPEHKGHRLTVDKLSADAPRSGVAGPLPLLHQSGDNYNGIASTGSSAGSAVAVVVVVCVGFLLLLIVVGVIKIRSTHRRMLKRRYSQGEGGTTAAAAGGDLAWDDGGLNITVNPLEEVSTTANVSAHDDNSSYSGSDDEDEVSYREGDECSDDEYDDEILPHVATSHDGRHNSGCTGNGTGTGTGLEWDDATLHHPAVHNPRTHTYRL